MKLFELIAERVPLPFIDILPVNALASGILIGISLGLLTRNGTSTGGTEVIPLIINKLTGQSVGFILFILDGSIMLLQLVYSQLVQVLYGVMLAAVYSAIIHLLCLKIGGTDKNEK